MPVLSTDAGIRVEEVRESEERVRYSRTQNYKVQLSSSPSHVLRILPPFNGVPRTMDVGYSSNETIDHQGNLEI